MIRMMFRPGQSVIYTPPHDPNGGRESGIVTSVTDSFVFVRYGDDTTPKATHPDNLWIVAR